MMRRRVTVGDVYLLQSSVSRAVVETAAGSAVIAVFAKMIRESATMPKIYPKMTSARLKRTSRKTSKGRGRGALPGVKTDAKHVEATDKCGYQANRDLAEMIKKAMRAKKKSDKHGEHFVLGWRLYPNQDHPRWNYKDVHSCGCGCGCSS
jgi:hypothetical protein